VLLTQPRTKKLRERYLALSADTWSALKNQDQHTKSKRQEENMIPMDDVVKRRNELREIVAAFENSATLTRSEYDQLLSWFIICLYTMVQPRRNQDYALMEICQELPEVPDPNSNYLVLSEHAFVFQKYKTRKHYGTQEQEIPEELMDAIALYLKHRPTECKTQRLIVGHDGSPLSNTNGVTRLLNRAFGQRIGATMLRHIYLSDKYAQTVLDRQADAAAMGHSVETAQGYIKI
jgi:integrase